MRECRPLSDTPLSFGYRWTSLTLPEIRCVESSAGCVCNLKQTKLHKDEAKKPDSKSSETEKKRRAFLPDLRAFRGRVLWAVVWELLFSTTATRKKHISSKCTVNWKCSFHMGLRVLRWMGLVRKWALSTGMPRTSTSMQGLPLLLPGQTFCPETIWGKAEEPCWLESNNNSCEKGQREVWMPCQEKATVASPPAASVSEATPSQM